MKRQGRKRERGGGGRERERERERERGLKAASATQMVMRCPKNTRTGSVIARSTLEDCSSCARLPGSQQLDLQFEGHSLAAALCRQHGCRCTALRLCLLGSER